MPTNSRQPPERLVSGRLSASGRYLQGSEMPRADPLTLHSARRFAQQNAPETAPVPATGWKS